MPKCSMCGKDCSENEVRKLSASGGREITICDACMVSRREPTAGKGYNVQPFASSTARSMKETHIEKTAFQNMTSSLDEIEKARERSRQEEEVDPRRTHSRHEVELHMQFSVLRDSAVYDAKVLDISQGGLRFSSKTSLHSGQVIKALVFTPGESKSKSDMVNYLEVRWVSESGGRFNIGGRFLKRVGVDDSNRRRHHRRKADCPVFFRRYGSVFFEKAGVVDISQGGMKISADCELIQGEEIEVVLRTRPPAFVNADLRGFLNLVRCLPAENENFECGGYFTSLKVEPIHSD